MYYNNNKNKKNLVNTVKANNSDDKVSAYTSWYNIIANADNRNVLPTEQTSAHLGTYRDPPGGNTRPLSVHEIRHVRHRFPFLGTFFESNLVVF
jgi:hypothetical protein